MSSSASPRAFTLNDFDYELPPELIAQHPAAERTGSRLLDASGPALTDRVFRELPGLLTERDLLVFNDTQVIKARLHGVKATGGTAEALIERLLPGTQEVWAHVRASKSPKPGSRIRFADAFDAEVLGRCGPENGMFHLRFSGDPLALLDAHGHVPLPPYITDGTRTAPKTPSATKPCSPRTPVRWPHPRPRCTLTKPCWPPCPARAPT
jgi:S-adenosylmethionine:tRNA ribosyltransferase-isomerase